MSEPGDGPRGRYHPVPIPQWWLVEARKTAKSRDLDQFRLADLTAMHLGRKPSQSQISLCLNGKITTLEMVDALSRVLEIPSPVYIAESRQEAVAFQRERLLYQQHIEIAKVEAMTGSPAPLPAAKARTAPARKGR